jgi:hypothetical protein
LARNLFAYYLNQAAGAYVSAEAEDVAVLAQDFLANIDFDGEGSYLRSRDDGYAQALEWSKVLDDYNNNLLDD